MTEPASLQHYLAIGAILFGVGLAGFVVRRNLIVMFLCVEMMLQGVSLSLIAWGRYHGDWSGQMLVIFVITVAACEAGIALVLILMLSERSGDLDVASWQGSRDPGIALYVDHEVPEDQAGVKPAWPSLTPAGVDPDVDPKEHIYRSNV